MAMTSAVTAAAAPATVTAIARERDVPLRHIESSQPESVSIIVTNAHGRIATQPAIAIQRGRRLPLAIAVNQPATLPHSGDIDNVAGASSRVLQLSRLLLRNRCHRRLAVAVRGFLGLGGRRLGL